MKEELVSFEVAKLAKEKKFNLHTYKWYYHNYGLNGKTKDSSTMGEDFLFTHSKRGKLYVSAPTQSLLQRWLREKHKIHIVIFCSDNEEGTKPVKWFYSYISMYDNSIHEDAFECGNDTEFDTYELALEDALKETLELI